MIKLWFFKPIFVLLMKWKKNSDLSKTGCLLYQPHTKFNFILHSDIQLHANNHSNVIFVAVKLWMIWYTDNKIFLKLWNMTYTTKILIYLWWSENWQNTNLPFYVHILQT